MEVYDLKTELDCSRTEMKRFLHLLSRIGDGDDVFTLTVDFTKRELSFGEEVFSWENLKHQRK